LGDAQGQWKRFDATSRLDQPVLFKTELSKQVCLDPEGRVAFFHRGTPSQKRPTTQTAQSLEVEGFALETGARIVVGKFPPQREISKKKSKLKVREWRYVALRLAESSVQMLAVDAGRRLAYYTFAGRQVAASENPPHESQSGISADKLWTAEIEDADTAVEDVSLLHVHATSGGAASYPATVFAGPLKAVEWNSQVNGWRFWTADGKGQESTVRRDVPWQPPQRVPLAILPALERLCGYRTNENNELVPVPLEEASNWRKKMVESRSKAGEWQPLLDWWLNGRREN